MTAEIIKANFEAANCEPPTHEEISYLVRGGIERRRCIRVDKVVWSHTEREARRRR